MRERHDMKNICPVCENHCHRDNLQCGRGVHFFESIPFGPGRMDGMMRSHEGFMPEGDFFRQGKRPGEDRMRFHGRGPDPREGHFFEEGFPKEGRCGRHGRPFPPHDPESLEGMFMMCARKLRHSGHRKFGSTQDRIIRILDENGGTMGQKALQELLHVQPGSVSEILAKMEEKGLIERTRSEDDRRASLIRLTTDAKLSETEGGLFGKLSEEEKETLKSILEKMLSGEEEKPEAE